MLAIFPKLVGQGWGTNKSPRFSRIIQTATSGKENVVPLWIDPIWDFELKFTALGQRFNYGTNNSFVPSVSALLASSGGNFISDDLKALAGFFMQANSAAGSTYWYYNDETDNWINSQQIGIGNASNTQFQITRNIGGFTERIQNPNGTPVLANYWTAGASNSLNAYVIPSQVGIDMQAGRNPGWQTLGWPFYFKCITAGTSGSIEPQWRNAPVPGTIIQDGAARWENIGVPLVVFVNGTPQAPSAYSLNTTGLITFVTPPALNAIVTIVCGFWFQCRFTEDTTQFSEFLNWWWEGKSLKFMSHKV